MFLQRVSPIVTPFAIGHVWVHSLCGSSLYWEGCSVKRFSRASVYWLMWATHLLTASRSSDLTKIISNCIYLYLFLFTKYFCKRVAPPAIWEICCKDYENWFSQTLWPSDFGHYQLSNVWLRFTAIHGFVMSFRTLFGAFGLLGLQTHTSVKTSLEVGASKNWAFLVL